jgi:hypothetical protein
MQAFNSDFCEFLCMEFGGDIAKRVVNDYALGSIDHKLYVGISPMAGSMVARSLHLTPMAG